MSELFKSPFFVLAIGLFSIGFAKACDYLSKRVSWLREKRRPFMIGALTLSMIFLAALGQIPLRYALNDVLAEYRDGVRDQQSAPVRNIEK
ncbi:hypothetical protein ACM7UX_26985 [Pseudomonas aeruginosa]